MEWRNLSVKDRAGLIRQMVSLGITTSKEQEKFYNDSITNPPKRKNVFNPNKPRYTVTKSFGFKEVPTTQADRDAWERVTERQYNNLMQIPGMTDEFATAQLGLEDGPPTTKQVPIRHLTTKANGGPIRFYHNDNKGKNQYINKNHYYRTQKGNYGVNATPFIEEKVYPYGPVWKGDMRNYRQEVTGRTYNQKYSEGLNIVPNIIGNVLELPTSRLQSQQKVINTYNPQGTLLKQVVKTYDHSLPLGQRRIKSVYEYANPGMKLFAPELNLYNSTNAADVLNSVNRR